jgi:ferredoxin
MSGSKARILQYLFTEQEAQVFSLLTPMLETARTVSTRMGQYYLDRCIGCGLCVSVCPVEAVTLVPKFGADYRYFQNTPAIEEKYNGGILIDDYLDILKRTGWYHTHIIQAPLSSQRFSAGVVSAMQKKATCIFTETAKATRWIWSVSRVPTFFP